MTTFSRSLTIAGLLLASACASEQQTSSDLVNGIPVGSGSGSSTLSGFVEVDLVADTAAAKPKHVDPNVVNAWGVVPFDGSFVIANNGSGVLAMVDGLGNPSAGVPQDAIMLEPGIDGIALNVDAMIQVHNPVTCGTAELIVASESGKLFGVNRKILPSGGEVLVDRSDVGAVFKGVAVVETKSGTHVLATDFHNGNVEVFDDTMHLAGDPSKAFVDPKMMPGFAPFNIAVIEGLVFVTYAMQDADAHDDVAGPGLGAIGVFDVDGNFQMELASGGLLNAPWGLALAPPELSPLFAKALIVGNFGDGAMTGFDPHSGKVVGQIMNANAANEPLMVDGLWGLAVAPDSAKIPGNQANWMYFTAGPNDEMNGLFGFITAGKAE